MLDTSSDDGASGASVAVKAEHESKPDMRMHFKGANVNFLSFTLSINFTLSRCENFRELKPNKKEDEEDERESVVVVVVGPETMLLFLRTKKKNVSRKINVRESEKSERERVG